MLATSPLIAFVATVQPDRATRFYRDVLGLRLMSDDEHALVFDANGTMLRVTKVQEHTPAAHTVLGWRITGIEATVQELLAKGVTFQRYPWLAQDQVGIWTAEDGTKVAWFKDPDGNTLSLSEFL